MKIVEGEISQAKQKLEAYESKSESLKAAQKVAVDKYNEVLAIYQEYYKRFEEASINSVIASDALNENDLLIDFHLRNIEELQQKLKDYQQETQTQATSQTEPTASAIQPMSQGAQ